VLQLIAAFLPLVGEILTALTPLLESLVPIILQIIEAFLPLVGILIEALVPIIIALLPLVDEAAKVFALLAPIIGALLQPIGAVAEIIADVLAPIITLIADLLKGLIDFIVGVFTGDWERAWGGIVGIFKGIWNGIVGIAEGGINGLIGLINNLINGVNMVSGPLGIGKIPRIPKVDFGFAMLAEGGLVPSVAGGVPTILGEGRYQEMVLPLSPKILGMLQSNSDDSSSTQKVEALLAKLEARLANPTELSDATISKLSAAVAALNRRLSRME